MAGDRISRRRVLAAGFVGSVIGHTGLAGGRNTSAAPAESATRAETDPADSEYHVAPDGSDDNPGTDEEPLRTVTEGLGRADAGETVYLHPGEYRETVKTVRRGESEAPITLTGPQDAVLRPPAGASDCLRIEHSHVHVRGITIDGLLEPDRKYETSDAWADRCVFITPVPRAEEGVEYIEGAVVEPARMGNCARVMVQTQRIRDTAIGGFEVIGPAGMQYDRRAADHEVGHVREIVYVGSPETHRGKDYYKYDTLDRSRNVRIHTIDNGAGYRHNELVDVKLGSTNVTVEYCTTRNAGHNTEGEVNAALDIKGNECTVRYNDIGDSPVPISFGSWAPSDDIDGGDWSQNNEVYGNRIHGFAAGPFRLRNDPDRDVGPVSFDDQRRLCGNHIERGTPPVSQWVGEANGFDGSVTDRRGESEVTVEVGAGSDGHTLAPPAVLVDRGATVTWEWVGDDQHYIVRQERVDRGDVPDPKVAPFSESKTFDEIGMYRFACTQHHTEGERGTVIVTDAEDRYAFARTDCEDVRDGPPAAVYDVPQDLDGDGLYEDVNGDDVFDIVDVHALYVGRDTDAMQNYAMFFDFADGSPPDEVTVLDVQALYDRLPDSPTG